MQSVTLSPIPTKKKIEPAQKYVASASVPASAMVVEASIDVAVENAAPWRVSARGAESNAGGPLALAGFTSRLPGRLQQRDRAAITALFNISARMLEGLDAGRGVQATIGGETYRLVAQPVEIDGAAPSLVYCRKLSITDGSSATTLRACRDDKRPIWRFHTSSQA